MTKLIVHKYGGTSMGSVERIRNVARRVAKWHLAGYQMVVVPSAMSGETNRLLGLAKACATGFGSDGVALDAAHSTPQAHPSPRELDLIAATGEQVSSGLLAIALQSYGIDSVSFAGWQVPIRTDSAFTKARIESIDDAKVRTHLNAGRVVIITGFQGVDSGGDITTLGRGGSDTSAVAVAAALSAEECLIYTDVDGVYTTDPRVVPEAQRLARITFEEMLEMASLGSKVLQIRSVEFAGKYKVKTRVLSSLTDPAMDLATEAASGTLITFEEDPDGAHTMEQAIISGIAFNRDEAKITLTRVPDQPGVAFRILGPIADANIDVHTDFSFTVHRNEYQRAIEVLNTKVLQDIGAAEVIGDAKIAKVSVVGIGMRSHVGIASLMFKTLAEERINIEMISTSEIKISAVIADRYMELAVRALHKAFGLDAPSGHVGASS